MSQQLDFELQYTKEHKPNLYKVVCNIFGDSFAYTKAYHEFRARKKLEKKRKSHNLDRWV